MPMTSNTARRSSGAIAPVRANSANRSPVGFRPGTNILTQDGEIPIEFLTPGDRIISRSAGYVVLLGLTRSRKVCQAVHIAAGALGRNKPDCDMILPADQPVLVRDWRGLALFGRKQAMVPAEALIDGNRVTRLGLRRLELFVPEFAQDQVIYAAGLEAGCETSKLESGRQAA